MKNEIHDQSVLTEKQIQRLRVRLYEVECAMGHWERQKSQANRYLKDRSKEKKELVEKLFSSKAKAS
tara:strand:+ start:650 stop:850 length:201 start_codon:yes stop_codon:yes gene_type:complete